MKVPTLMDSLVYFHNTLTVWVTDCHRATFTDWAIMANHVMQSTACEVLELLYISNVFDKVNHTYSIKFTGFNIYPKI